jgi:predicted porin
MQKKLIALAIAGLSSAAFAQSNVTIYGVMDATMDNVSSTGATSATDFGSRTRINSNSSYIGFKGVESLGNGLAAAFQIESGLQSENGAAGVWNNRDTYVGLAGGFGTVVFGNVTGPTRAMGAKFDVNSGATGIGANTGLLGKGALATLGLGGGASPFDQRISNALAYISPNMGGFSGVLGYSTGFTGSATFSGKQDSAAGSVKGNTAWTLGLNYDNGPIYVGYAYTVVNTTNSGAAAADGLLAGVSKAQDNRLGAMYKFGQGTVGLLWDQPKFTLTAGGDLKVSTWMLPVTFNVGAGKIIAQYGKSGNVSGTSNTGAKQFELGYEYSLSKRTTLKALWSQISNDSGAGYDFLYPVAKANSTATQAGAGLGADPRGFSLGIRHSF